MKPILLLMVLIQLAHASGIPDLREENIDLGKGQVLTMVNLKDSFWVGKYEVTQGQWLSVMGKPTDLALAATIYDPSLRGDNRAMDSMGLVWAEKFCSEVSRKTGRKIRLPTELEWEFYASGTQLQDAVCAVGQKHGLKGPADVGSKGPNRFGLYDVLGNVMEICSGNWHDYKNPKTGKIRRDEPMIIWGVKKHTDPPPWTPCRGGCYWMNSAMMIKVEFRDFAISQGAKNIGGVGLRVVCDGDKK